MTYYGHSYARIRELEQNVRTRMRSVHRSRRSAKAERQELADDVGFLALTLVSLVRSLVEKGVITEEEFRAHMEAVDGRDGEEDGRMDPGVAREDLGAPAPPPLPLRNPGAGSGGDARPSTASMKREVRACFAG